MDQQLSYSKFVPVRSSSILTDQTLPWNNTDDFNPIDTLSNNISDTLSKTADDRTSGTTVVDCTLPENVSKDLANSEENHCDRVAEYCSEQLHLHFTLSLNESEMLRSNENASNGIQLHEGENETLSEEYSLNDTLPMDEEQELFSLDDTDDIDRLYSLDDTLPMDES